MRGFFVLVVFVALLATACGSSQRSILEPAPAAEATVAPTSLPEETPVRTPVIATPVAPPGRVATNVTAVCRLGETDAVIYVTYRAQAVGTSLNRVRLMLNNKVADDSGEIFDSAFEKVATVHVVSGKRYTLTVSVTAPNAYVPQVANIVGCPRNSGPSA